MTSASKNFNYEEMILYLKRGLPQVGGIKVGLLKTEN